VEVEETSNLVFAPTKRKLKSLSHGNADVFKPDQSHAAALMEVSGLPPGHVRMSLSTLNFVSAMMERK